MRVEELTAEFGIAGVLDFLETEHGLVKAAISLGGMAGELYLQGAQVTAWQPAGGRPVLFTSPNAVFAPARAGKDADVRAAKEHAATVVLSLHCAGSRWSSTPAANFRPSCLPPPTASR
jgi:hypothetical protein